MSDRPRPERTRQRGSAAFELPLLLGLILIPFGVLVLSVSTWVERQTAARDAAGEVARLLVVDEAATVESAEMLLRQIELGYGLPQGSMELQLSGERAPGTTVVAEVTVEMPGAVLPLVGSLGEVTWTAEHGERVPDYGASS